MKENINIRGKIFPSESLAEHTTFRIGGPAELFIEPADEAELIAVMEFLGKTGVPCFILGGGSNVVISDDGLEGAVISTAALDSLSIDDGDREYAGDSGELRIRAGSGCTMEKLLLRCRELSLSGLEEFAGLPGTVGGAVYMNARCYGRSVSDVLRSVTWFDRAAEKIRECRIDMDDWDYKKSPFQNREGVILSAVMAVKKGKAEDIASLMERYIRDREEKGHFRYPSAGSVFKNSREYGKPSGLIIDEAGLRGYAIGGAQVAPWHGNIIINTGNASASDVARLVGYIRNYVRGKTGFDLEPEILFAGPFQDTE
ncbi:MAG: UDP-N-acetylmuramate dehydrogenase [Spirochaetaceae bacterium]|nr:UDP-N-acetylmuramate dehydrogenase [Spirochaetaceae bacterium]